jgi:hypothetical protein
VVDLVAFVEFVGEEWDATANLRSSISKEKPL